MKLGLAIFENIRDIYFFTFFESLFFIDFEPKYLKLVQLSELNIDLFFLNTLMCFPQGVSSIAFNMLSKLGAAPWRNGSASDSRSEGCVFKSRRGHILGYSYFHNLLVDFAFPLNSARCSYLCMEELMSECRS